MGSSAKKKKEKRKDFQKPKLKVGKTKPKASNFTDTSFKAKSIVLNQQSIAVNAPSASAQFDHHLSLLTHKSDTQKRDSLAYLTTTINSRPPGTPLLQPGAVVIPKVKHLMCDGSSSVRTQLLKLLQALPASEVRNHENEILQWIRVGMTHMASEIRHSALDFLSWLLSVAGERTVSAAGAWFKTIRCFLTLLNWNLDQPSPAASKGAPGAKKGWSTIKISDPAGDSKAVSKTIQAFAEFLWRGLEPLDEAALRAERQTLAQAYFPLTHTWLHMIPTKPNAYAHLHLFGPLPDEENAMLEGRDERQEVFAERFQKAVESGLEWARKEQGEVGRAAKVLEKAVRDGMKDFGG